MIFAINLFSVELADQNARQGELDVRRCVIEKVADPYTEASVFKSCRVVDACEWKEFDFDLRNWSARPEFAKRRIENMLDARGLRKEWKSQLIHQTNFHEKIGLR